VRVSELGGTGNSNFAAAQPAVSWNATNNEYLVLWQGDTNVAPLVDNESEIWGQRLAGPTAAPLGGDFRVSNMGPDGNPSLDAVRPAVAWNATNNEYLVAWDGDTNVAPLVDNKLEVWGQRLAGASGAELGADFRISRMGPDNNVLLGGGVAAIAWNATRNQYLLAWQGDTNVAPLVEGKDEIWAQQLDGATGAEAGAAFRVSVTGSASNQNDASAVAVVWNATQDEYFPVWSADETDDEFEIWAQRLSGADTGTSAAAIFVGAPGGW
jgi:hypothetical protein